MKLPNRSMSSVASTALGVGAGAALTTQIHRYLPTAEQARSARADAIDLESADESLATVASVSFVAAVGTAAGLARRGTSIQSTSLLLLGAAGMFTSLAGSTLLKSEHDGRNHMVSLGALTAISGAGYLLGASSRIPFALAHSAALGSLGVFAGTSGVETGEWVTERAGLVSESIAWKRAQSTAGKD